MKLIKEVSPGIYRSGRQTYEDLKEEVDWRTPETPGIYSMQSLKSRFKTIINLENDPWAIAEEKLWCKELGICQIEQPLSGFWKPNSRRLLNTALMLKTFNRPLLIHCKNGTERTGIVVAKYRVCYEGWSKQKAIKEALQEGFSPLMLWWYL